MSRLIFGILLVMLGLGVCFLPGSVDAYWVEFNPGTCQVGPPPNCVAGHWYWVDPGSGVASVAGMSSASTNSFHGQQISQDVVEDRPSEVSCMLEREEFTLKNDVTGDDDGSANALALGWQYTADSGTSIGINGFFEKSKVDSADDDQDVMLATLAFRFPSSDYSQTALTFQYTKISSSSDLVEDTGSYGGGFSYLYNRYWSHVSFSLGLGVQVSKAILPDVAEGDSEQSDLGAAGSLGLGFGVMFTERLSVQMELFNSYGFDLSNIDDSVSETGEETSDSADLVQVGGFYVSYLFTDFWGLTLGYKKLMGIETYDGNEITLGSSIRF